jgi:hypothetical protein
MHRRRMSPSGTLFWHRVGARRAKTTYQRPPGRGLGLPAPWPRIPGPANWLAVWQRSYCRSVPHQFSIPSDLPSAWRAD